MAATQFLPAAATIIAGLIVVLVIWGYLAPLLFAGLSGWRNRLAARA